MAYTINKFSGEQLIVLEDGTIDTSTSIGLVGRNYVGYGETQNENFVFLLENFANPSPPARPLIGQTWFSTENNLLQVYNGNKWTVVGSATLSDTAPEEPSLGEIWLKTPYNVLYLWSGEDWTLIGPETAEGFGVTRARSTVLLDSDNVSRPVILLTINTIVIAIISSVAFTLSPSSPVSGFGNISAGITMSLSNVYNGNLQGNADTATKLADIVTINGVPFDGSENIVVTANTTNMLVGGDYIVGENFNGSRETNWSVDASPSNMMGKVVARNAQGGFAAGTITADLVGDVSGNVTTSSGTSTFNIIRANQVIGPSLRGTADTAIRLQTGREINGVVFDGSFNITVPADAQTLTGLYINGSVKNSSLTSVGTLVEVAVENPGVTIGSAGQFKLLVDGSTPTIRSNTGSLNFDMGSLGPDISFINSSTSVSLGGPAAPAIIGDNSTNLGIPNYKFNNIYANTLVGNAQTATLSTTSTNIIGGSAGSLPYQTSANTTAMLPLGALGTVLTAGSNGTVLWSDVARENLNKGSYITLVNTNSNGVLSAYDATVPVTIAVDASSSNSGSKIVARDSNGDFAARNITATLIGNSTGNSASATQLQTPRLINGVSFNGTSDISITAVDPGKVPLTGGSMSGYLTLVGAPVSGNHAATKTYVDGRLPQFAFTYGQTYSTSGFTNQVGSWNFGANHFDIYPPAGRSMGNLVAFIPSIAVIHYAGGVNGDDSMVCTYSFFGDRIRVYVQNTEQRSTPAANWLVIWS
jgi:hypothetical protein